VNNQVLLPPPTDNSRIEADFTLNGLELPNGTFMVLGASGTIGKWLTSTLLSLPSKLGVPNQVIACGREPKKLSVLFNPLSNNGNFRATSIESLEKTIQELRPNFIWHLAANTGQAGAETSTAHFLADSHITSRILGSITEPDYRPVVVYTSSGAVYGRNRIEFNAPTEAEGAALPTNTDMGPYEKAKIVSELMLNEAFHDGLIDLRIARLYAFVGPLIPLDRHFAIGNFLRDAMLGNPIRLKSAGIDYRSWMSFSDLVRTLLLFASNPSTNTLNFGSPEIMQIREAAEIVARVANTRVVVEAEGSNATRPHYYFPNLEKFNSVIELPHQASLSESINDTLTWLLRTYQHPAQ
jgi:nucleoside-diphosphate-sugar epimerase